LVAELSLVDVLGVLDLASFDADESLDFESLDFESLAFESLALESPFLASPPDFLA
jgi:hypothetical protein